MELNCGRIECERIKKIAEIYVDSYRNCYDRIKKNVVRTEYGIGGELQHRGYYCPSIVIDIINGNVKRGKRVKNIPEKPPEFVFGFDRQGRIITVDRLFNREFIILEELYELGISFSEMGGVELISECTYDTEGRIKTYGCYLYNAFEKNVYGFQKEEYEYEENRMTVDWYQFDNSLINNPVLIHEGYIFDVENTYLKNYCVKHYKDETYKLNESDEHIYNVSIKRKLKMEKNNSQ